MSKTTLRFGVLIAGALFLLIPGAFADTANLSVGSPSTVSQGSTFTVDVNIANVTDLYDYQFDLTFNPSVLSATNVSEGAFLSSGGGTFFLPGTIDNVGGTISFNADTLISAVSGVSGAGTLVVFDFAALAPGVSDLTIENEILQDSTGEILSDTTTGASVTVNGAPSMPEPSSVMMLVLGLIALAGASMKRLVGPPQGAAR